MWRQQHKELQCSGIGSAPYGVERVAKRQGQSVLVSRKKKY